MKDFLSINDCSAEQLKELLRQSRKLKSLYSVGGRDLCLEGKTLAMLFEKPSLRTRISFEVAMTDLGGNAIYVKPEDIGGLGKREPIKDIARVLSRYVDGIMARTFEHSTVTELAKFATVPVINALTDWLHPTNQRRRRSRCRRQYHLHRHLGQYGPGGRKEKAPCGLRWFPG